MPQPYLLGLDLGTTGAKALLIHPDGTTAAAHTCDYPLSTPCPLWAEQDPEAWWQAAAESIRAVLEKAAVRPEDVAGVGLTGQMHGLVLLDAGGRPLRPAMLWNDQRTGAECREIRDRIGEAALLEHTGNQVLPGFTLPKIVWVRKHEPEVYARVQAVLLPKDYIRYRLTGVRATDVSDASGTSMFDVRRRTWSAEVLDAFDIPRSWLPGVTESPVASARVGAEGAAATLLRSGTPVVAGAGDQAAQAVGSGIVDEGLVSITLGTSGVVFAASNEYRVDPLGRLHAFCHAAPGLWHVMGVMLSAGGSLRWFRDTLGDPERTMAQEQGRDPYEALLEAAGAVPAGSDGLVFLPYLTGERTPYADPYARGVFCGLTVRHTKPYLTRAVVEGVSFGLKDSLDLMRDLGLRIERLRASGGGARSGLWRQVLADVCGAPIAALEVNEGAALGAALLAGVGVGLFPDVRAASRLAAREASSAQPGPDAPLYARLHGVYRDLYAALAPIFPRLSA